MILVQRFYDILLSVYIYNEWRGQKYLRELLLAFAEKYPAETQMIQSIRKHADDEYRHYLLFKSYFITRGKSPYQLSSWYGYCDQMTSKIFGQTLHQLDPSKVVQDDASFFRLCRLIMITEMRGMKQVHLLLQNILVRRDPELTAIFRVVQRDEPSHCYPYQAWLRKHGAHEPSFRERWADWGVHYSLMLWKLPLLYLNPFLRRAPEF